MKNLAKLAGIITLAAVIGFSFAACGGDSGGGGGDDPSSYLGATLEISGEQVYTRNESEKLITFDGDLEIDPSKNGGGIGAIAKGKLTYTFGTPSETWKILDDFTASVFYVNGRKQWGSFYGYYDDVKVEPSDAQWFFDECLWITGSDEYSRVYRTNDSDDEFVEYTYVDKDVKITGKGKTYSEAGDYDGEYEEAKKTENINLSLKKGWNAVHYKYSLKGDTYTESMSLRNPKNFKWVLLWVNGDDEEWDDDEDEDD